MSFFIAHLRSYCECASVFVVGIFERGEPSTLVQLVLMLMEDKKRFTHMSITPRTSSKRFVYVWLRTLAVDRAPITNLIEKALRYFGITCACYACFAAVMTQAVNCSAPEYVHKADYAKQPKSMGRNMAHSKLLQWANDFL